MNKSIDHKGTIIEISENNIKVEIINKSLCSACHAKSVCSVSDAKDKIIDIPYYNNGEYEVGELVIVEMAKSMGFKAVWLSYVIPLTILLFFLLTLHSLNLSEVLIGIIILFALGLYYLVIYLLRDKIANKFLFSIKKNYK